MSLKQSMNLVTVKEQLKWPFAIQIQEHADKLNKELQQTRAELDAKNSEIANLKDNSESADDTADDDLKLQLVKSEDALAEADKALNEAREEVNQLTTDKQSLQREVEQSLLNINTLTESLQKADHEKTELKANITSLSNELENLRTESTESKNDITDNNEIAVDQFKTVETKCQQLTEQLSQATAENTSQTQTIDQLQITVDNLKESETVLKDDLSKGRQELEDLKQSLSDQKVQLDEHSEAIKGKTSFRKWPRLLRIMGILFLKIIEGKRGGDIIFRKKCTSDSTVIKLWEDSHSLKGGKFLTDTFVNHTSFFYALPKGYFFKIDLFP